jgi:transglutaminase-like putative cysteine protease
MRLKIRHETRYGYASPAARVIQTLRLMPRGHASQFVVSWRIDVDQDCRLTRSVDPFGNAIHAFTLDGPIDALAIVAEGSVETQDTSGVLSGQVERFPPEVFLRVSPLTTADAAIRDFARAAVAGVVDPLDRMHRLMEALHARLRFDTTATDSSTAAADAFAMGHGVCQDFTHVFVAAARELGVPARYTSGYLFHADRPDQEAGHAWAEALVDGLGWVGFDAANGVCPTDAYVRVAIGLDYLGAAPVRGARVHGGGETLAVSVNVRQAGGDTRPRPPSQWQRQSQT